MGQGIFFASGRSKSPSIDGGASGKESARWGGFKVALRRRIFHAYKLNEFRRDQRTGEFLMRHCGGGFGQANELDEFRAVAEFIFALGRFRLFDHVLISQRAGVFAALELLPETRHRCRPLRFAFQGGGHFLFLPGDRLGDQGRLLLAR